MLNDSVMCIAMDCWGWPLSLRKGTSKPAAVLLAQLMFCAPGLHSPLPSIGVDACCFAVRFSSPLGHVITKPQQVMPYVTMGVQLVL